MSGRSSPQVTFAEMKGAIGSLISLSSLLEQTIGEAIDRLDPNSPVDKPQGLGARIARWSELAEMPLAGAERQAGYFKGVIEVLDRFRRTRNLICHNLAGIAAGSFEGEDAAHLTVLDGQSKIRISLRELEEIMAAAASTCFGVRTTASSVSAVVSGGQNKAERPRPAGHGRSVPKPAEP